VAGLRLQLGCDARRTVATSLRFHRQFDVDRFFFFAQGTAQFRKRDVLELTNTLSSNAEFLADFFESLWLTTIEPETLEDDLLLAIIKHVEQTADFISQIFVPQKFERRLRVLVAHDSVESSSLMGASSEAGRIETVLSCETLPAAIPISSPSSSSVGSRPSSSLIWSETRRIFEILSTRCTGKRIVFDWFASARLIDCLIHQAA
jgi:hypothetical protein